VAETSLGSNLRRLRQRTATFSNRGHGADQGWHFDC